MPSFKKYLLPTLGMHKEVGQGGEGIGSSQRQRQ